MDARRSRAGMSEETLEILRRGFYISPMGATANVDDLVRRAASATRSYPPEVRLVVPHFEPVDTEVEVENESTLAAARRLVTAGYRAVALNFASAKHPGGGFLSGAHAQEESLARASGLYACLADNPMYDLHRRLRDPLYTSYAIYSPDVPVFRGDDGTLLDSPYLCSFITAPAANARVVLQRDPARHDEIGRAMRERISRVLAIAMLHGHSALVLGAWGCGVFGNDPRNIASLFAEALGGPFRGAFRRVVFAVLDTSRAEHAIRPFRHIFGHPAS